MAQVAQRLQEADGAVVYYYWVQGRSMPSGVEVRQAIPLQPTVDTERGGVFAVRQPGQ
jgi:hypothetical protein